MSLEEVAGVTFEKRQLEGRESDCRMLLGLRCPLPHGSVTISQLLSCFLDSVNHVDLKTVPSNQHLLSRMEFSLAELSRKPL